MSSMPPSIKILVLLLGLAGVLARVGGTSAWAITVGLSDPLIAPIRANGLARQTDKPGNRVLRVTGELSRESQTLQDGSYYNTHPFEGQAGEVMVIELTSEVFDTYLILQGPDGETIARNDDSQGSHSSVMVTLPITGTYTAVASSYAAGESGAYQLLIRAATEPEQHLTGELSGESQTLEDGRYYNTHPFEGQAGDVMVIELMSQAFDAYLILQGPDEETVAENDDSGGTHSRVMATLPVSGPYTAVVSSYAVGETGVYQLLIRVATEPEPQLALDQ